MLSNNVIKIGNFRVRLSRRSVLIIVSVLVISLLEICLHVRSFRVAPLKQSLDVPFATRCHEPDVHGPRENATILMLARNSDVLGAIRSIESLEKQFNRWFHYPIIFLNDVPWEQTFVDRLTRVASSRVMFEVIDKDSGMWGFPEGTNLVGAKAAIAKQGWMTYGGLESYHHMCRFNSGYPTQSPSRKSY